MLKQVLGKDESMKQKIGILIYPLVQPMDFIGPWEIFSFWKNTLKGPVELYLIAEKEGAIHCDNDILIQASYSFKTVPQLDYLVVPGGRGRLEEVKNANLIHFIQTQFPKLKLLLSVCTGAFLVHQAHVLTSSLITTYWRAIPELQSFKDVQVVGERIVRNDKVWFAGGVSSGIDLALALIAEIAGKETAGKVQLLFEYFPKDTVYATADLASHLPAYSSQSPAAMLPAYIQSYIKEKNG